MKRSTFLQTLIALPTAVVAAVKQTPLSYKMKGLSVSPCTIDTLHVGSFPPEDFKMGDFYCNSPSEVLYIATGDNTWEPLQSSGDHSQKI